MPPGEKRIRTLVVDDSADFMRYLCAFLETLSNVAVIAKGRSGREALTLTQEWMPDLVLLDIRMQEMTGLEVCSQLTRELPDVIVILMSAFEDEGNWRASQQSGAFAFVMKENLTHDLPLYLNWRHRRRDGTGPQGTAPEPDTVGEIRKRFVKNRDGTEAFGRESPRWSES